MANYRNQLKQIFPSQSVKAKDQRQFRQIQELKRENQQEIKGNH